MQSAALDITFPGNLAQVPDAAALRLVPAASLLDNDVILVSNLGLFVFDASVLKADDGVAVIKPQDYTPLQSGRWVIAGDTVFGRPIDRPTLAALKAGPASGSALYDASLWAWTPGDFTGRADDVSIVQSDNALLITGAWVRQNATNLSYTRPVSGAKARTIAAAVAALGVTAGDYSAKFDGSTDDAAAVQSMVDDAANAGVPVILPGAASVFNTPLDLRGRYVDIRGIAGKTYLRAGAPMDVVINAEEGSEVSSFSPLRISGVLVDGANLVTNAAMSIRFRREFVLDEIFLSNAPRGLRQKDANNGSMRRLRTSAVGIALHSEGSNHATHHDGCSFINAATTGVLVQNMGTALDGNNALVFTACVIQDGAGDGFDVAPNTSVNLVGCYVGETTVGFNFVNRGGVITVDGGIVYFGFSPSNYVTRPLGGSTYITKAQLFSQNGTRGTALLSGLTPAEAGPNAGKIKLKDCNSQFPVAGNVFLNGDVLASDTIRVFAPRLGKSYTLETNDLAASSELAGPFNNARRVVVTSVTGGSPILGLQAALTGQTDWRDGEPFYLAVVYSASKPVNVRTNTGVLQGGVTTIGEMPASASMATYVKVESNASSASQSILEFYMTNAAVGDNITIYHVGLADSAMIKNGIGVMPNLYLP